MTDTPTKVPKIEFNKSDLSLRGIEVLDIESLYSRVGSLEHDPTKPHRINFFLLVYVTHGEGEHFIDFINYPYKERSVIFIKKEQIQAFDFTKKIKGKVVMFSQDFVNDLNGKLRLPIFSLDYLLNTYLPVFEINEELKKSCDALLFEISKENNYKDTDNSIIELLFSTLLLKLMRERPQINKEGTNENQINKIRKFLSLVENNYASHRSVTFYADKMAMSYKQLNQLCKQFSINTAKQLIDCYILLNAKRKLIIDQSSVKEVSYQLGFDEISNFIKFFKKHSSYTPAQFKKNHKS